MFDTADQGTTAKPADVRTLTAQLEHYLLPKKGNAKAVPPRVKFVYGSLEVVGVMSALNLEFDLFADSGMPLRAKASVTIKEQKPEFDADLLGPGANTGAAAANPLPRPRRIGRAGLADRTGTALGGESGVGLRHPHGSRPLHLEAAGRRDQPIRCASTPVSRSTSAHRCRWARGWASPPGPRPERPVGRRRPGRTRRIPPRVTAAGGLSQALSQQTATTSAAAAAASRAAFPGPTAAPVGRRAAAAGPATVAAPVAAAQGVAPVPSVTVDPRAASYGFGIPLRPLVAVPIASRGGLGARPGPGRDVAAAGQLRRPHRLVVVELARARARRVRPARVAAVVAGVGASTDAGHRGRGLLHRRGRRRRSRAGRRLGRRARPAGADLGRAAPTPPGGATGRRRPVPDRRGAVSMPEAPMSTTNAPVVKTDGTLQPDVGRDLLRLEVAEGIEGLRTLALHVVGQLVAGQPHHRRGRVPRRNHLRLRQAHRGVDGAGRQREGGVQGHDLGHRGGLRAGGHPARDASTPRTSSCRCG